MQIIHSDGLGNEEKRKDKKPLIADNIMSAILTLISEMSFVQENQLHDNDGTQLLNVLIFLTEPTQSLNKPTQLHNCQWNSSGIDDCQVQKYQSSGQ